MAGNDILRCLIMGEPPLKAGWGWGERRLWGPSSDILRGKEGLGAEVGASSSPGSTSSIRSMPLIGHSVSL